LRILRIVGDGQDAPQRAVEKRRLRRPEGNDRKRDARQGQRRIVQAHLVVTGRRAAEVVERPVAGRLCGEDRVLYAHVLPPELHFAGRSRHGRHRLDGSYRNRRVTDGPPTGARRASAFAVRRTVVNGFHAIEAMAAMSGCDFSTGLDRRQHRLPERCPDGRLSYMGDEEGDPRAQAVAGPALGRG
jgi:hypothetical protein